MKLIEKLAKAYLQSRKDYDPYYENDHCQNNYTDMREAFQAGFRKAREMAAKEVSEWDVYWQDPEEGILSIGEEEV